MRKIRIPTFALFIIVAIIAFVLALPTMINATQRASPVQDEFSMITSSRNAVIGIECKVVGLGQAITPTATTGAAMDVWGSYVAAAKDRAKTKMVMIMNPSIEAPYWNENEVKAEDLFLNDLIIAEVNMAYDVMAIDSPFHSVVQSIDVYCGNLAVRGGNAVRRPGVIATATQINDNESIQFTFIGSDSFIGYNSSSKNTSIDNCGYGYPVAVQCAKANAMEARDYSLIILQKIRTGSLITEASTSKDLVVAISHGAVKGRNTPAGIILLLANRAGPDAC